MAEAAPTIPLPLGGYATAAEAAPTKPLPLGGYAIAAEAASAKPLPLGGYAIAAKAAPAGVSFFNDLMSRAGSPVRIAHHLLALALAIGLVALAWPRLLAALHFLPVQAAIERFHLDRRAPTESLEALLERAHESVSLHPHPRYWAGICVLSYLRAVNTDISLSARREAFEQSLAAADESLKLAPVQPRLWLYRALAQSRLSFRGDASIESLKRSIYSGRVEPALLLTRLELAYRRLGQLDEEAADLLVDQTRLAWRLRERDFVRAMQQGVIPFRRVSALLDVNAPAVLLEMEERLAGPVR